MGCGSSVNQMENVSPPKEFKQNKDNNQNKDVVLGN